MHIYVDEIIWCEPDLGTTCGVTEENKADRRGFSRGSELDGLKRGHRKQEVVEDAEIYREER